MNAAASPAQGHEPLLILVAEDNRYDRLILQEVFAELNWNVTLRFVAHGEEAVDYLKRRDRYAAPGAAPRPALILMDLNMPRMTGDEVLRQIRADPELCMLPVIVLSTADSPKLVVQAYASGINAFMTKPGGFDEFVELFRKFGVFWLEAAKLPIADAAA
ncbi:MAG: response regulator [Acetobacteraceae bacterium]